MRTQQRRELTAAETAIICEVLARGEGQRAAATAAGTTRHAVRRLVRDDRRTNAVPLAGGLTPDILVALTGIMGTIELHETLVDDGVPGRPLQRRKLRITVSDLQPADGGAPNLARAQAAPMPRVQTYDLIIRPPRITRTQPFLVAAPAPVPVWRRPMPVWARVVILMILLGVAAQVTVLA